MLPANMLPQLFQCERPFFLVVPYALTIGHVAQSLMVYQMEFLESSSVLWQTS